MSKRNFLVLVIVFWVTGIAHARQPKFKVLAFYSEKVEMGHVLFARRFINLRLAYFPARTPLRQHVLHVDGRVAALAHQRGRRNHSA